MKAYLKLGIGASIFFVFVGAALAVVGVVVADSVPLFIFGLLFAAIGIGAAIHARKELRREIEKEKELRKTHGDAFVDAQNQKTNKILKKFALAGFIAFVIISAILVPLLLSDGGDTKEGCRNCGRTEDLVPGFGYCEDCYEGFVDWQDRTWAEDND